MCTRRRLGAARPAAGWMAPPCALRAPAQHQPPPAVALGEVRLEFTLQHCETRHRGIRSAARRRRHACLFGRQDGLHARVQPGGARQPLPLLLHVGSRHGAAHRLQLGDEAALERAAPGGPGSAGGRRRRRNRALLLLLLPLLKLLLLMLLKLQRLLELLPAVAAGGLLTTLLLPGPTKRLAGRAKSVSRCRIALTARTAVLLHYIVPRRGRALLPALLALLARLPALLLLLRCRWRRIPQQFAQAHRHRWRCFRVLAAAGSRRRRSCRLSEGKA